MNETERKQIKGALLKCAEENENRPIFTGYVVVSSVCKSAVERIEELEKHNAELLALINAERERQEKCNDIHLRTIADLEKENATLKKQLEAQIEKMKCCQNCENWNWKHSRCEKKLKGDCFKQSKWVLRKILSKEYE